MKDWTNFETSMVPPSGQRVPSRPEELTTEWLTACLRHHGALGADARVTDFTTARIGEGRGFAGRIVRVALRYSSPERAAPATPIAKFATDHGPTRDMMSAIGGYMREVRFYRELAKDIGVPTPECYFAHYDREQGGFCLLIEDLAPAASSDREQGFTVEQAELVLGHLAVMHARYWNRIDEVSWLALTDEVIDAVRERFLSSRQRFVERWGAVYPEIAAVAAQLAVVMDGDELRRVARLPPLTLAHNDLHLENVFLPTAAGGRFTVIDWQSLSANRHGTTDVTRVLCVGLRPELRRQHERRLLSHYHRALRAHGVRGFSRLALSYRYRQEMVAMVLIGVLAFDTLDFGVTGEETARTLASRIDVALKDANLRTMLRVMVLWMRITRTARQVMGALTRKSLPR